MSTPRANGAGTVISEAKRQGGHVAEMQRHRLLLALVEVVAEHGLGGAGVGRVCKRAGVSRRTFYDLFEDREACFLATFELVVGRLTERVVPAYLCEDRVPEGASSGVRTSWHERMRRALTVLLECFDEEPGLARLCLIETLKGGPEVLECRRRVLDTLARAVDEGRGEAKGAEAPPLTAEGTVGGAIAVIHTRLLECYARSQGASQIPPRGRAQTDESELSQLVELVKPLMSMIVHPYLGPAASRRELDRSAPFGAAVPPSLNSHVQAPASDPFKDLPIRITFRTARVLDTIGSQPGASNREVGAAAGVADQGQMSKLLRRLEKAGLIDNRGEGQSKGEANAWQLTARGRGVLRAVGSEAVR
jgi:AcrR family transcriptional regulator/DNA-binding MarR family transcriptional regulator